MTYRSRWDVCDDCGCVTLVERNDDRGVPDPGEWEEFGRCHVCGGSLKFYNADKQAFSMVYLMKDSRLEVLSELESRLVDRRTGQDGSLYILRQYAAEIEAEK